MMKKLFLSIPVVLLFMLFAACEEVSNEGPVPSEGPVLNYMLSQNYPNPFADTTVIEYQIPKSSQVALVIYDSNRMPVRLLVGLNWKLEQGELILTGTHQAPGYYSVTWDGKTIKFIEVSAGMYICELRAVPSESSRLDDTTVKGRIILFKQ